MRMRHKKKNEADEKGAPGVGRVVGQSSHRGASALFIKTAASRASPHGTSAAVEREEQHSLVRLDLQAVGCPRWCGWESSSNPPDATDTTPPQSALSVTKMSTSSKREAAPSSALSSMLGELRARCPKLCPAVIPAGLHDSERGVALLALCNEPAQKRALAVALQQARSGAGTRCALTGREVADESALRFVAQWDLHPTAGTYRLRACGFACPEAAQLLDTAGMLERFTHADADAKELGRLAQIFCEANEHAYEKALDARLWLQECLALATSCQVVASSLPAWKAVGPSDEPLRKGERLLPIVRALLGVGGDSPGAAADSDSDADGQPASARSAGGSKQRKGTSPRSATPSKKKGKRKRGQGANGDHDE
jgi:hypothetical protein